MSAVDYEARRAAIFNPGGAGQQGQQQPPATQDLLGGQGPPPDQNPVQEEGQQQGFLGAAPPAATAQLAPPVPQEGAAQIAVLPATGPIALYPTGGGVKGGHPYSGIGAALERLSAYGKTNEATSQNLKWQRNVNGDLNKAAAWTAEATSLSSLQFFALMQPGQAHIVVGHSMSTIYSTTTNVESLHGKLTYSQATIRAAESASPSSCPRSALSSGRSARPSMTRRNYAPGTQTTRANMERNGTLMLGPA